MRNLLKAVSITQEMLDRRDTLKRVYGASYAVHIVDAKRVVSEIARRDNKPVLEAALWICQRALNEGNGGAVNFIIAAACDLIEEQKPC